MSEYTTQVRFICETAAGLSESEGQTSVKQIIAAAIPSVFDFDFPIFDESYRNVLETKILKHYYTREIGLETVGLWKLKMDTKLNEIMPYYNQLYKSELLEFNPFYDVDLVTDHKLTKNENAENTGTIITVDNEDVNETFSIESDSTSTSNNISDNVNDTTTNDTKTHYDKYSDTPQGALTNIENNTYLTNARLINDNDNLTTHSSIKGSDESHGNSNSTSNSNRESNNKKDTTINNTSNRDIVTVDEYLQHIKGKNGGVSYSHLLKEYRSIFLNIDMQVINELAELFFNLY
jgi:hypothetical protein|nr:MAG TPA: Lower collar protein [Caudoviricetes sp.]